jgi:hypothetical protein
MENNGTPTLKGLDITKINELLSNTRTKGAYEAPLKSFVESDEVAISVTDNYPMFAGKELSTLYQGFTNSAKKLELTDEVMVKRIGEGVYLFHNGRLEAQRLAEAQAAATS